MPGNVIEAASELMAAREIQQQFMKDAPREVDYRAECRQAGEVGGDFHTCFPAPGDWFAFAVGDASGKGLGAALIMASVQASLRTAISLTGGDRPAALAAVNREIYELSPADRYATLFHAVFDPATRTLRYVNAGHNPPLVVRRDGPALWLETGGAPVGMFPDWKYEEGAIQLYHGDFVIAYTDGVIDAVNAAGEQWGVEGLERAARESEARSAKDMARDIFAAMEAYACGPQEDDVTVAVLRV